MLHDSKTLPKWRPLLPYTTCISLNTDHISILESRETETNNWFRFASYPELRGARPRKKFDLSLDLEGNIVH